MRYLYIAGTILFTVYGQLMLKWRIAHYGNLPNGIQGKISFLLQLFWDQFIISGFIAAFIAALFWMAAMTKFEISLAYPFMSLSFVLVLIFSGLLLNETITSQKIVGLIFIVIGIYIASR